MTGNAIANPATEKFVSAFTSELVLGQVLITRSAEGFDLRHEDDRDSSLADLRPLPVSQLRDLAQKTASGAFRPLKSAPNLQRGWRATVFGLAGLDAALRDLYPGAVPDWFAVETGAAEVSDYRAFTERQTGMYRVTTKLNDTDVAQVVRACCPKQFCLKRRLWTVPGLPVDAPELKSLIPCLEPCAVFLEFARTAARINQAEKVSVSTDDVPVVMASLETALEHPDPEVREADFTSPRNPRRVQLALERMAAPARSQ